MIDALGRPQTVLLLGGTSDIGLATVRHWISGGTRRVLLAGRDAAALQRAADDLRVRGATDVVTLPFDAADVRSHEACVAAAFAEGDVDVTIAAFGVLGDQDALEHDPDQAAQLALVNYVGVVSTGLRVAGELRRQGHGVLVVLSSVAAERPRRSNFLYGSTKAGVDAFGQGLGDALRGSGAWVLVVRPGWVATRMTAGREPAPMATTPQEVAVAIATAVRRRQELVWVPAQLRPVMSVLRHLPRPVFRRLPI